MGWGRLLEEDLVFVKALADNLTVDLDESLWWGRGRSCGEAQRGLRVARGVLFRGHRGFVFFDASSV